ncbi:hypothetical protein [Streptomyces sp. NPDC002104]
MGVPSALPGIFEAGIDGDTFEVVRRALFLLDLRLATHPYWAPPTQLRTGAAELRRTARTARTQTLTPTARSAA